MRTNIVIDDDIMQAAMRGSEFKTKREAVEAGLKLLARQNHYREVLKWEGKLHWDDQPDLNPAQDNMVMERMSPQMLAAKGKTKVAFAVSKREVIPARRAPVAKKKSAVA
jgi:antitoxin ParD1/3/4